MVPYLDQRFQHNKKSSIAFVKQLIDAGIVKQLLDARERLAIFFVAKKHLTLRMTVDRRKANFNFRDVLSTMMPTLESFAIIEVPDNDVQVRQFGIDVKDNFFSLCD